VRRLLVTDSVIPSPLILVTLMMEARNSSETSLLTRSTRRNIPEDGNLHAPYFLSSFFWSCNTERVLKEFNPQMHMPADFLWKDISDFACYVFG
jgi:hypothetical protein